MRASTSTLVETRRGPAIQVEAENDEDIVIRVTGRLANVSIALHPDEARALSFAIDTAASVVEVGA
jgi:hypothetical protein